MWFTTRSDTRKKGPSPVQFSFRWIASTSPLEQHVCPLAQVEDPSILSGRFEGDPDAGNASSSSQTNEAALDAKDLAMLNKVAASQQSYTSLFFGDRGLVENP